LGVFEGKIVVEGKVYEIKNCFGFAEEHDALW